jgi:hypothetical protein
MWLSGWPKPCAQVREADVFRKRRVRIRHDGDLAFRGVRTTRGASGSCEVRIVESNRRGADRFKGLASNVSHRRTVCRHRDVLTPTDDRNGRRAARRPSSRLVGVGHG